MHISTTPQCAKVHDIAELGALLRAQRQRLQITQATAASLSGVSTRLWSECETGKRAHVGLETVIRMLNTVGIDLAVTARRMAQAAYANGPKEIVHV
jgi:transcriptional regulator with XRE-family HTH domain